jgi:hypothetical protein
VTQGVDENIGAVAAIEAELHLGKVAVQMLRGNLVPRADDPALEQRKGVFDRIIVKFIFECVRKMD